MPLLFWTDRANGADTQLQFAHVLCSYVASQTVRLEVKTFSKAGADWKASMG